MKKIVLFTLIVMTTFGLWAQEKIHWYTINEAVELNKKEPRLFMVDVYTDWCGWCKRMDANTFSNEVIAKYVNANFYPVKLNGEEKDSITIDGRTYVFVPNGSRGYNELAAILLKGRLSYPSIVYLNPGLQIIEVVPGYKTPPQLEVYLAYYHQGAYKRQTITEFAQTFRGVLAPPPESSDAL